MWRPFLVKRTKAENPRTPVEARVEELMSRVELPVRVWAETLCLRYNLHRDVAVLLAADVTALARELLRVAVRLYRWVV